MRILALFLLLAPLAFGQSRAFKDFDLEGKKLLEAGKYEEAALQFKAALRAEPKPDRYRAEGTFMENYLPRYSIALCYEKLEILEAADWVSRSKEALERNVLKKKKEQAKYDENIERILKAAGEQRLAMKRDYDMKLNQAKSLVSQSKFDDARKAYEALIKLDGDRPEARAGLAGLEDARKTYLDRLSLNVERAIFAKKWADAEAEIARIATVDKSYVGLASLRSKLNSAKEEANKPPPQTQPPVQVAKNEPKETKPKAVTPKPKTSTPKVDKAAQARAAKAAYKKQLREKLLETVVAYRRGDSAKALDLLNQIPARGIEEYGSYFWLKGLYSLHQHRTMATPDAKLMEDARTAMTQVAQLMPKFEPEPRLYPEFVINFYASLK